MPITPGQSHMFAPIHTSLDCLDIITDEQKYRLSQLIQDWRAQSASVTRDTFTNDSHNVVFVLFANSGAAILNGLIEPDGRSHT